MSTSTLKKIALAALVAMLALPVAAEEWPLWRGSHQNGTSPETGLPKSWSPEGENLAWKAPFVGRSTPVVAQGRVCVIGRTGEGKWKQEVVACYDANDGTKLWERRHNVYHTTVAFNRVGWASLGADPETGWIYAHGVAGQLIAYKPDGTVAWERFLTEELGRKSGYGGRTQTPIVWGDQLILTFVSTGWGAQAPPRHRHVAFDKRTGEIHYVSTPGNMVYDMNTQSGPVVAEIGGRQLLVVGNADGHVYATDLMTGNKVWEFELSRRGLNSTVLVDGDIVYASHSEENLDGPTMGRLVAFKATGSGDLTGKELWRIDELSAGFPSPAFHGGKLYVVDNSANLYRIDGATGAIDYEFELGTVGKASPVFADGKLYVPELNGRFHILKEGKTKPEPLDLDELMAPDGERYAEIYGSPAIAGGRVFLSTEGWLYAIGDPSKPYAGKPAKNASVPAGKGEAAFLRVFPAEIELVPGATASFEARAFDASGLPLGPASKATWSVEGLRGAVSAAGDLKLEPVDRGQGGAVVATAGGLSAKARVRVVRAPPWTEDFNSVAVGTAPPHWIGAGRNFTVVEYGGGRILEQPVRERGLQRSQAFFGGPFSNYTIEAEVQGSREKRRVTDIGLINSGYTMRLMGYHQRIEVASWEAERRMAKMVDFEWDPEAWYRIKLRVDTDESRALIRGKVWKRGAAEPEDWTIVAEDPLPIRRGSPGIVGYAPSVIHYDNISVTPND